MRTAFFVAFALLLLASAVCELADLSSDDLMVRVQAVLHAGALAGLAAASLSFVSRHGLVRLMMIDGVLCLVGLMGEDVRGLIVDNPRWQKDLTDLIPRLAALIVLAQRLRQARSEFSATAAVRT